MFRQMDFNFREVEPKKSTWSQVDKWSKAHITMLSAKHKTTDIRQGKRIR